MIKETNAKILYDTENDTYSFKLAAPLSVCWQVTKKCNLNCLYCLSSSGKDADYGLTTEQAIELIDGLGRIGVNRLDFTGGEPLMRKDLGILIDRAKQNNINTIVTTNTLLLNKENMEVLKKADLVQVSIDGNREIHNYQRNAEVFDKMLENVILLKKNGCKIRLNSFIFNSNKDDVDFLMDLSQKLGVFSHLFIIFTPQGRGREHLEEIVPQEEVEQIKEKILARKEKEHRNVRLYDYSEYMHSCVLLTPRGEVISQGFYEEESIDVGNVFDKPLEELFQDDNFSHFTHVVHYLQRRNK